MPNLTDVLEQELSKHDPGGKLDKILDAVTGMSTEFGALSLVVQQMQSDIAALKGSVQAIQVFLGAPTGSISSEDQAALDAITKQTSDLETQVGGILTTPPQ